MRVLDAQLLVSWDDMGSGERALLLLPGWCADRSVFAELARHLAPGHRILALDWRGHGQSARPAGEFGEAELVEDALDVIRRSGVRHVIPVALAHAGWVAIALARRLRWRVPGMVLLDWQVLGTPPGFQAALMSMQSPATWRGAVNRLLAGWLAGSDDPRLVEFVHGKMGAQGYAMWARAARAIQLAYAREGNPLAALARLDQPPQVLHVYAQPKTPEFLVAQQGFARSHPWYQVELLEATSHFPVLDVPETIARLVGRFAEAVGD